jgi:hypothetical protein
MKIDDIQISGKPLVLAKDADVDAFENEFWIEFPPGYREYVTKLGEGVLGGSFIRIYPPWKIRKELDQWRRRINKHWLWETGRKVLPKERALECIIIGDTVNGDELVFHPVRPRELFVLPRSGGKTTVPGTELLSAVDWMCSSGKLTRAFKERQFEPFDSRKQATNAGEASAKITDPEGESLDAITTLGQHWAKRHQARKKAQAALKEALAEGAPPGATAKLRYEAILLDGEYPFKAGYLALFGVNNAAGNAEVGTFSWRTTETSSGYSYQPANGGMPEQGKRK